MKSQFSPEMEQLVLGIYVEMIKDRIAIGASDRHSVEFKAGFNEATRILAIIIKEKTGIDVRK